MQRALALNSTIPKTVRPVCKGQLNIGIFFDGTGNNLEADFDKPRPSERKHSNVVKLFQAYPENYKLGFFRFYIPGVGTKFDKINDSGKGFWKGAFAWDGENRITWAFTQLLNAPKMFVLHDVLMNDELAGRVANNMASIGNPAWMRRSVLRNWQEKLASELKGKKPQIELINLSVFGFSRGSAEARAFSNWLFEVCEQIDGGWRFAGIPIRLGFLGIFDTVASVGIPDSLSNSIVEGHQSWADNNMAINPAIEQCVHFVAGHEVRAAFPLDSVRTGSVYPPNAKEVMYPGAHSDLGGGYAPNALGISPAASDSFSIIPGAQMFQDARIAGVPLIPWSRLMSGVRADLTPSEACVSDFNAYIAAAKIQPGPVEQLHQQHMSLYLSYRYKYRNATETLPFYQRASPKHKTYLRITSDTFNLRMSELHVYPLPPTDDKFELTEAIILHRKYTQASGISELETSKVKHLYEMAPHINLKKLAPAIEKFFGNYVHDSMAGFIEMGGNTTNEFKINGLGILKLRKIFKENG